MSQTPRRDRGTPLERRALALGYRAARRIAIAVVGGTLLFFGVLMLVLPGPGVVAIAAGLAVLAAEFAWAGRLLHHAKQRASAIVGGSGSRAAPQPSPRDAAPQRGAGS
jgi:tellurite resistance protein TerC